MGDVHDGSASTVGDDHFHPVDSTHSKTSTITCDGVGIKRWLYDPPGLFAMIYHGHFYSSTKCHIGK
jgi:hypothetical protein